ncbi:unnamed protein product [Albugo candida]|uniref:Uncharacterized protein n=1 Tax=Albugo candida TaxID=65357 RepID=A0A024GSG2_9STRA|nr:unnamed protein product [Albugo candida]|eukprot:CCI49854.1 unnamed protein product [Albugo candida]
MKYYHLEAYGLAVVGVLHAWGSFAAGQYVKMVEASPTSRGSDHFVKRFGLEVEITPSVKTNNDGTLMDPQPISKEEYTIKLLITKSQTASVRQEEMARTTGQRYKASLLDNFISWLRLYNMERECTTKQRINGGIYCTAWKKTWKSLKESVERKELYVYPKTSINAQVYFPEIVGFYSLIWNRYDNPDLYLGELSTEEHSFYPKAEEHSFTPEAQLTESALSDVAIEFLQHSYPKQKVTLHFDNDATQVPPEIFEEIGKKGLDLSLSEDGHYKMDCSQLDAFMAKLGTSDNLLELTMKHAGQKFVTLLAEQSFVRQHDRCGLLIEKSTRAGEWVMGSSLLKAYTAIVDTRNKMVRFRSVHKVKGRSTRDM